MIKKKDFEGPNSSGILDQDFDSDKENVSSVDRPLEASATILEVQQISKSFPGVRALSDVSLSIESGSVVAVVGENGAGKSTLMKILAGVQQQDTGKILLDGKAVRFHNTQQAMQAGISLIHQELNLCDNLNVAENLFLGMQPNRFGFVQFRKMTEQSIQRLKRVGLEVSPNRSVASLSIGQRQQIEIAKALSSQAKFIIFDEPTSSLSEQETHVLFRLIEDLKSEGVGVVYISHRLGEVMHLADKVVVLRDGKNAGELKGEEICRQKMISMMIGREFQSMFRRPEKQIGQPVLEVKNLRTTTWPSHSLNFRVHQGEIVGLAGLVGAGRSELLKTIFGIDPVFSGDISMAGNISKKWNPQIAIQNRIGLVPEDRKHEGLLIENSVQKNVGLAGLFKNRLWGGFVNQRQEVTDCKEATERMRIKTPGPAQPVGLLSGGNQQKVVMGKWLALDPALLMLDEPTRGVDVGARQEIYQLIQDLACKGEAILFASSDLEEVIGLADRVLVMHEGKITGELTGELINQENIMTLATGSSLTAASN